MAVDRRSGAHHDPGKMGEDPQSAELRGQRKMPAVSPHVVPVIHVPFLPGKLGATQCGRVMRVNPVSSNPGANAAGVNFLRKASPWSRFARRNSGRPRSARSSPRNFLARTPETQNRPSRERDAPPGHSSARNSGEKEKVSWEDNLDDRRGGRRHLQHPPTRLSRRPTASISSLAKAPRCQSARRRASPRRSPSHRHSGQKGLRPRRVPPFPAPPGSPRPSVRRSHGLY